MEKMVEKYGWKKVALLLVIVSLLVLIYVMYSFSAVDKSASDAQQKRWEMENQGSGLN